MRERDPYPSTRDPGPQPPARLVRPRGVPDRDEREVERQSVGAADRPPLPPPVTVGLDDGSRDAPALEIVKVETVTRLDESAAVIPESERSRHTSLSRDTPTGFLDAHGANGPGFLSAHGEHGAGFLATHDERAQGFLAAHGAREPGWLTSLEERRRVARALGWQPEPQRDGQRERQRDPQRDRQAGPPFA